MEATTTESPNPPMAEICSQCKESFEGKKDPQLLPCLHSFCTSCLQNMKQDSSAEGVQIVACSSCKQLSNTKDVIVNRFVYESLNSKESQKTATEEKEHTCSGCEPEAIPAADYCVECAEWLCGPCVTAHKRVRVTKDHTLQAKDEVRTSTPASGIEKSLMCSVHKNEPLKLYCDTCEQLTCRDCQLASHKDHKYNFVTEHSNQQKIFLKALLDKISEKRAYIENAKSLIDRRFTDIQEKEQKVSNEIKMFAIKFITDINKRGKELLADLNAVCTAKRHQLSQKHKEILNLSSKLDHAMLFTQQALTSGSSQALLYSKKTMSNQLRNVLKTRCEVPNPHHHIDIKFSFDTHILKHQVPNLGHLQVDGIVYSGPRSPDVAKQMPIGSPTGGAVNINQLSQDQQKLMIQRMMLKQKQQFQAGGSSPVSPNAPNLAALYRKQMQQSPKGLKINPELRNLMVRQGLLPPVPVSTGSGGPVFPTASPVPAGSPQGQISSTSTSINGTTPTQSISTPSPEVSGTAPTSSTGAGDNSRPSSSDSGMVTGGGIKLEPGLGEPVRLNPKTFSFDADPASLASINIKREARDADGDTFASNQNQSPPQSPGSTNQNDAFSEHGMDHIVGFQQQPTCKPTNPNDPNEDYCACCHNGGDLLCCDTCPNVFHLKCHVPEILTAPSGNWSCGLCIPDPDLYMSDPEPKQDVLPGSGERKRKLTVGLSEKEIKMCERILLEMFCDRDSPPFHEPVSKAIPNYHKIITNPMDFTTVKCKLSPKHFNHYHSLDDFVSDVRLVFINCAKYNSEMSEVGKAGRELEKSFEALVNKFAPWYVYTYSHEVRDTSTPNSTCSEKDGRPNKRKRKPEDIMHVTTS